MVNYSSPSLDRAFGALADPTRRAIVSRLAHGPASTTEIAAPFHLSLPGVLKHLGVLERAGIIRGEKRGRIRRYHLWPAAMHPASAWLDAHRTFWETQLDTLEAHLEDSSP